MFERFTERSRHVVVLAQAEARLLRHNYIGTEHLLLGLVGEEEGLAGRVLDAFDVTVDEVRAQVARRVGRGDEVTTGEIPFTPRAKKALELALREALSLGHEYIDTQHILLGLVRENEGVAAHILLDFDADAEKIRNEIVRMQSGPSRGATASGTASVSFPTEPPEHRPQLVVACPNCATAIQTVTVSERNANLHVSMQGSQTCPSCGRLWVITVRAGWTDPSPPADPEDDFPSGMTVWHYSSPRHFSMYCFRCDHILERVTLDQTMTPPLHVEADTDRTCPGCSKAWQIAYTVSWEQRPGGSSSRTPSG